MKRIITICTVLIMTVIAFAQAPNKMSFQAVIRNNTNALVINTAIGMRISILQTSINGSAVYIETQTPSTNANGLVSIEIGAGTVVSGNFANINWANGSYFVKTETDPAGGTSYTITGTTQLLSVPYALYAKSAGSLSGGSNETDPVFGASVAKAITGADTSKWNKKQNRIVAGAGISISGDTLKAAPQYQSLSIRNDTVFLTNGGFVKLPNVGGSNAGFTHYIGEEFGGGVIFHLWKDAQGIEHGLIVDKTDLNTSHVWSNVSTTLIGSNSQSSWDGIGNSNAIVGQAGHTNSAAALCLNSTNGGYIDWYLPSIDELSLLWHNRFNINKSLATISGASVMPISSNYWSSLEILSSTAWRFSFHEGGPFTANKVMTCFVRAVRAF
jgi:hypothetical protein